MPDARDHVAWLCQSLGFLRGVASAGEVDALVTKARAGEDVGAELTDLLRRCGLPDPAPQLRGTLATGLPGSGPGHFLPDGYVCPTGRCTGWRRRRPGGPRPFCEIEQVDMHRLES